MSAYGISQAQLQVESSEPFTGEFHLSELPRIRERIAYLKHRVHDELVAQGANSTSIKYDESLSLRYFGTDTNLAILRPDDEDYGAAFVAEHLREFAFALDRNIIIDSIHIRGTGNSGVVAKNPPITEALKRTRASPKTDAARRTQHIYFDGAWAEAGVYRLEEIEKGSVVDGPALILDATQTIVTEPGFRAYILPDHVVLEKLSEDQPFHHQEAVNDDFSPIQLSVFAHRFMSIAEQMGNTLQRTSISTSIRERLDFSCAVFSPDGRLVANAPHIPIHLGSMQLAIQAQHIFWKGRLHDGDVLMTNHPEWGGTHLPDVTVVTPIFVNNEIAFYTASRGHHTDIGTRLLPI